MLEFYAQKWLKTAQGKSSLEISFSVQKGEFLSLYGKSGVGKTTILRIIAGLTHAEKSHLTFDSELWNDSEKKYHLPIKERLVGFVFQDFGLFPNLTVKENLTFALQKNNDKKIIDELLELMELQELYKSKPQNLSGGQKQRVAIAQAIVRQPKILLLDEPFSSLDDEMRLKLQDYMLKIHKQFQLTTIMVSHNLYDIIKLSDKIILIDNGKIISEGTPNIFISQLKQTNESLFNDVYPYKNKYN